MKSDKTLNDKFLIVRKAFPALKVYSYTDGQHLRIKNAYVKYAKYANYEVPFRLDGWMNERMNK